VVAIPGRRKRIFYEISGPVPRCAELLVERESEVIFLGVKSG
jgi:hypothetical protein